MVVMLHIEEINQSSNFSFWRDVVLRDCYERKAEVRNCDLIFVD
ncbi:Uncharacterised protein [Yersinia mollaretii]|nr:Uncharacterised protein [Yersinia mollaretii]